MTVCGQSSKERPQARPWGVVSPRDSLRIGCVNVTSMGKETDGRAELAVDTLQQYKLAVCGLCGLNGVRWGESGKRQIAGYTVFYSGRKKGTYGVGNPRIYFSASYLPLCVVVHAVVEDYAKVLIFSHQFDSKISTKQKLTDAKI
jgi:hypothetical protein